MYLPTPNAIASCVLLPLGTAAAFGRAPVSAARLIGRNGRRYSLEPAAASCPVHAVRVSGTLGVSTKNVDMGGLYSSAVFFVVVWMSSTAFLRVPFPCTSSVPANEHSCVRTKKRWYVTLFNKDRD
jgi:hypothetical protein